MRTFSLGAGLSTADRFLFLLNSATGDVAIHRLLGDGSVGPQVYTANWTGGWTTASFYSVSGRTFLFLLKRADGVVHIHSMETGRAARLATASRITIGGRLDNRRALHGQWTPVSVPP